MSVSRDIQRVAELESEEMSVQARIDRLQFRADMYKQLLEVEEGIVVRFNAYPVPERIKDEAHALRVQYDSVHYNRIIAGVGLFEAKMELYYATGEDEQQWPPQLRRHHPKYDRI
jgi:hypothetical protein